MISVQPAFAYRPFLTEDAGVAGKSIFQSELGWDYILWKNSDYEYMPLVSLILGLGKKTEISIDLPYMIHRRRKEKFATGPGDLSATLKQNILTERKNLPAVTLRGAVKLPTGNPETGTGSGTTDISLLLVLSKQVGILNVHAMAGKSMFISRHERICRTVLLGIAADVKLTGKIHLAAEVSGFRHSDSLPDHSGNWLAGLGLIFNIRDNIVLDAASRRSISPNMDVSVNTTLGVSITF